MMESKIELDTVASHIRNSDIGAVLILFVCMILRAAWVEDIIEHPNTLTNDSHLMREASYLNKQAGPVLEPNG